ncbi:chromatin associated protein KTI12 (macronuclear) [Tetrahymena thermophila SB210]|uniref:Chromatin associated protein KTI12 n=1 Tax=Tetrahymena thermophila (strain SB210) TaxID=312017 RepID=Q229B1_TETTS|nr:chromatin associated protein KTI12 [Tetrahymena thermophila SB210]EAR81882.1 chromatin associated protein KTI12 [Tetrahymena thermophila SB210]|eukprot:XP_001029545.1 chromatin associated protein KTI12 [Tetrahymena thermophila SB210]
MPLIVFCGIPGSGKTTRALQIKEYLEQKHKCQVVHLNEEILQMEKKEVYKDFQAEKFARGFLRSNVEKNIAGNTVVILDSLNYIKGYRYELFCLARAAQTQHCVIYCECDPQLAKENNSKNANNFTEEMLADYNNRLEIPIPKNRWDSPLFHLRSKEETPFEEIANVLLYQAKKSKDPVSTAPEIKFEINFLQELDLRVQSVIDELVQKQQESIQSNVITFSDCTEKLMINKQISLIELKKIKQEYLKITKHNPPKRIEDIKNFFIIYLQKVVERF